MDGYSATGPNASRQEMELSQRLDFLRQQSPPVPSQARELFPPRFGYPVDQPTIEDVLSLDRWYMDNRRYMSGAAAQYSGTSRYSMSDWEPLH